MPHARAIRQIIYRINKKVTYILKGKKIIIRRHHEAFIIYITFVLYCVIILFLLNIVFPARTKLKKWKINSATFM